MNYQNKKGKKMSEKYEFFLWILGILLVITMISFIISGAFDTAKDNNKLRQLKVEACQTIENLETRALCIEHA